MEPAYDLPTIVVGDFNVGSTVRSMDFHPLEQDLLLVGTSSGGIFIWKAGRKPKVVSHSFWVQGGLETFTSTFQDALAKEYTASVTCALWSPDGCLFGIAYSKSILKIFSFRNIVDITNKHEIEAHSGRVNDFAFTYMNKVLCVITCGDDKKIKVWHSTSGHNLHVIDHNEEVYSVLPDRKAEQVSYSDTQYSSSDYVFAVIILQLVENLFFPLQYLYTTETGGKILYWCYSLEAPLIYDAPCSCSRIAHSSNGKRIFFCGTDERGIYQLVEWDVAEAIMRRTYVGIDKPSLVHRISQFDTTRNEYLAVLDDKQIKFWHMDNVELLRTVSIEENPSAFPCLRFNNKGTLLAVPICNDRVRLFANAEGSQHLLAPFGVYKDTSAGPCIKPSQSHSETGSKDDVRTGTDGEKVDSWTMHDVIMIKSHDDIGNFILGPQPIYDDPSQIRFLWLPDQIQSQIARLVYTKRGDTLIGLSSTGIHKFWRWPGDYRNPTGQATVHVPPLLWRPAVGHDMENSVNAKEEFQFHCIDLSVDETNLASASGKELTVFNVNNLKVVSKHLGPPQVVTSLAFDPHCSKKRIAIGLHDSTIQIYILDTSKLEDTFNGHKKRVSGLAFSEKLNILVSAGADNRICTWSMKDKVLLNTKLLLSPEGELRPESNTRVQFNVNEIDFLVVHAYELSIFRATDSNDWVTNHSVGYTFTDATFSCNGEWVYACFIDGSVGIFDSKTLQMVCQINNSAFLPLNPDMDEHASAIAAHPNIPGQFAIAMSEGGVVVIEPPKLGFKWGQLEEETLCLSSEDDDDDAPADYPDRTKRRVWNEEMVTAPAPVHCPDPALTRGNEPDLALASASDPDSVIVQCPISDFTCWEKLFPAHAPAPDPAPAPAPAPDPAPAPAPAPAPDPPIAPARPGSAFRPFTRSEKP